MNDPRLHRPDGSYKRVDLHMHSHVSDGHLSPAALVAAAVAGGLDVIALTDHDTAEGVEAAMAAAEGTSLLVIPGIEISTRSGGAEYHILGYWIDPTAPGIIRHQQSGVLRRIDRMRRMVERLQEMGLGITYEDVERAAGNAVVSIGRPHLARALMERGITRYHGEAFERYISDTGPAFVDQILPSPEEAIRTIHEAGGIAVWAHPPATAVDVELDGFVRSGLDGVECYRPSHTPGESAALESRVRRLGLIPTGGSDWHGPHRSPLGEFHLRAPQVAEVLTWSGAPRAA